MRPEEGLVPLHHLKPTVQRAEFPFVLASEGTSGTACDGQVPQTCSGISTDCTLVAGHMVGSPPSGQRARSPRATKHAVNKHLTPAAQRLRTNELGWRLLCSSSEPSTASREGATQVHAGTALAQRQ